MTSQLSEKRRATEVYRYNVSDLNDLADTQFTHSESTFITCSIMMSERSEAGRGGYSLHVISFTSAELTAEIKLSRQQQQVQSAQTITACPTDSMETLRQKLITKHQ